MFLILKAVSLGFGPLKLSGQSAGVGGAVCDVALPSGAEVLLRQLGVYPVLLHLPVRGVSQPVDPARIQWEDKKH